MKFLRQIKFEIRNILRSGFLLIIGILILVASIAVPLIGLLTPQAGDGNYNPTVGPYMERAMIGMKYGGGGYIDPNMEAIIVNGITIASDNPFYWNLSSLVSEKSALEVDKSQFADPATLDLVLAIVDQEIGYYLRFAQNVVKYQDYRIDMAWQGIESLYDKFFLEHTDVAESALLEAALYRKGMDPESFKNKYINITAEARLAAALKADEYLAVIFEIVENSDFPKYIALRIRQENDQITSLNENIAIQEQAIIDNPSQEDNINAMIEDLKRQIELIETNNIPILNYRLEKNIIPGENTWQNIALSDIENSRNQLVYLKIMTEEEWNQGNGGYRIDIIKASGEAADSGRGTYQEYVASMQKQIDQMNKTIIIAQKSLESNEPDMKYVPAGSRSRTIQFLDYSMIVALFGVLLGGWLIASEYQQGTIRLLMIRPKTRIKILSAKLVAALLISLFVDLAGSLLNFITNGISYGFSDFLFPNYSIGGATGFLAYYIPKLLICLIPIIFLFTIAFMFSVVIKNTAVSIIIPIALFIASTIIMGIFSYSQTMAWIAYTPIPFIQISSFFQPYSLVQQSIQNGMALSLPYGIALLLALSAIFIGISIVIFRKRDIVN